ncbi:hypothetical protein BZA05DRAFT_464679 [Tricharina praecox]|uniref:uncharacterized protein n=1 Tax=Tricharina praecox TaxID=43433 RepID=UPI00221FC2E1|nr:uncharacterized protein BZA05DRAFT_464679 [Tricharina praecox]KAI5855693.1 hypothetical protein BZA05DRAFT_464679 [Tricharina praecox]
MSFQTLPTELLLEIASYLSTESIHNVIQTCKPIHSCLRETLYHDTTAHSRQFIAAATQGQIRASDLSHIRQLALSGTDDAFVTTILPQMSRLRSLTFDGRSMTKDSTIIASIQRVLSTSGASQTLRSFTLTGRPEYYRNRSRLLIPFNFADTGPAFPLSGLTTTLPQLSHLDTYGAHDLCAHPSLQSTLRTLVLNMPALTAPLVSALFALRQLHTLRIVEPKAISAWTLPATQIPAFTGLREFGFGRAGAGALDRMLYVEHGALRTLPDGFVEAVVAKNPGLQRVALLSIDDKILAAMPSELRELEVAFSFDADGEASFATDGLAGFLVKKGRALSRLVVCAARVERTAPLMEVLEGMGGGVRLREEMWVGETDEKECAPDSPQETDWVIVAGRDTMCI